MTRPMTSMLLVPFALTFLAAPSTGQQSPPDLVLLNGKIFTSASAHPYVEALAIRGGRIMAVGTSERIASFGGPQTKRIDLSGRVVIPGINDAHYHLFIDPPLFQLHFKGMDPTWAEVKDQLTPRLRKCRRAL